MLGSGHSAAFQITEHGRWQMPLLVLFRTLCLSFEDSMCSDCYRSHLQIGFEKSVVKSGWAQLILYYMRHTAHKGIESQKWCGKVSF